MNMASSVKDMSKGLFDGASQNVRTEEAVCLYSDIEHFTALSETMEPMQLRSLLNRYFSSVHRPIVRHGGTVLDLAGDAMLAVWVAPQPNREARYQACCAVLAIQEAVDRFNRLNTVALRTRIGVHCGQIALGRVGSPIHSEYRAVGDVVNTASRIEALNKTLGTEILVSAETLLGLDEFLRRPLGEFLLRGKSKTVQVHELIGRKRPAIKGQYPVRDAFKKVVRSTQKATP